MFLNDAGAWVLCPINRCQNLTPEMTATLQNQLATLRALWRTAPSGWREFVRTYHAEYYAEWCQALGVEA